MSQRTRFIILLSLPLVMLGCSGDLTIATGPRAISTRGGSQQAALLGRWQRVVTVSVNGVLHSSETTWEFRADGLAIQTIITRNLSSGIGDATVTTASWSTSGRTIFLTFLSQPGSAQLDFTIFGNVLTLNGQDFVRIA
jgi:hypothetical protein